MKRLHWVALQHVGVEPGLCVGPFEDLYEAEAAARRLEAQDPEPGATWQAWPLFPERVAAGKHRKTLTP